MRLDLDMPVNCVDERFGKLADVVIDPGLRRLTNLVVEPPDRSDHARLVPIEVAQRGDGSDAISLQLTAAELERLDPIRESVYIRPNEFPAGDADWDVGIQEIYPLPESGQLGPEALGSSMALDLDQHVAVSYHRVPKGGVEIRRDSAVTSSDGHHVGHVIAFIVDDQGLIEHLVLQHGHLWGKRQVAIQSSAIERLENDEVTLSLSSDVVSRA